LSPARPLVVAHRAGNDLGALRAMEVLGVDVIEADLHLFHGAIEVRHEKTVGPLPILWERWRLVRPFRPRLRLADLLASVAPSTCLMLDLKGISPRLPHKAMHALERALPDRPYWVCARNWLLLRPFEHRPGITVIRSVAGPIQLWWFRRTRRPRLDGVSVHHRLLDAQIVAELRARCGLVLTWGVTTEERARELQALGVGGLILDDRVLMQAVLAPPSGAARRV
jgi:glycerophosphoryl diester phosphodiesterase